MSTFFGDRLASLRGTRTKAAFARELGIPAPMYHRYELGQVPKHDNLKVIASKCGVTIEWLLNGGQAPPSATSPPPAEATVPSACRVPADCDIKTELADLRAEVASMRGSLDTLLGLLGGPLRSAVGLERDDQDRAG